MPLPTGPVVPIKFAKAISRLPTTLTANTLYAVRSGVGMDLYVSDMTGNIAFKSNAGSGGGGSSLRVSTLNLLDQEVEYTDNVSNLSFDINSGFSLTDLGNGQVKVGVATTALRGVIKTFNILNSFSSPLIGTSIFVPTSTEYIRSVQLTNGQVVGTDLTVGLYRNNELLGFFSIPAGSFTAKYTGINFRITPSDYITVNAVAGSGQNFSLALVNIDL